MKRSDVENRIKTEAEKIKAPEIYDRVSRAPLNPLFAGASPQQAFRKKLATLLLVLILAIFSVMTFALVTMAFDKPEKAILGDSYVAVSVENGASSQRFAFVVDSDGIIKKAVNETVPASLNGYVSRDLVGVIDGLYAPKLNDKVVVSALNDDYGTASGICASVKEALKISYGETALNISVSVCSTEEINRLSAFIEDNGGVAESDRGIASLINAYFSAVDSI